MLPHENTLYKWCCKLNGKPGFTEESFNLLVKLVKKYLAIRVHKFIKNHNVETKKKSGRSLQSLFILEMNK